MGWANVGGSCGGPGVTMGIHMYLVFNFVEVGGCMGVRAFYFYAVYRVVKRLFAIILLYNIF